MSESKEVTGIDWKQFDQTVDKLLAKKVKKGIKK